MKIPKKLKILGHIYEVKIMDHEDIPGSCGEQNHSRNVIKLRKDLPISQLEQTFIHEILHAINPSIQSEETIEFWAQTIYQVFKENKLLS